MGPPLLRIACETIPYRKGFIEVARTNGVEVVIRSGLKPGETIVTDGHLRLVPGSRIAVKEESRTTP